MKKSLNVILAIVVVLIFSYIAFLTVLPTMLEKKLNAENIKKVAFSVTCLKTDFKSLKVYTTSNLGIGLKIIEPSLMYFDDKDFFKAGKVELEVAAIPLIFNTVKFNKISATAATVDIFILANKNYKITEYLKDNYSASTFKEKCSKLSKYTYELAPLTLKNYTIIESDVAKSKSNILTGKEHITSKTAVTKYVKDNLINKDGKALIKVK